MFQRICPECGRAIDRQGECSLCELEPDVAPILQLPGVEAQTLASPTPLSCEGPIFRDASPILPESEIIIETPELRLALPTDYSALTLARMQPVDFKSPSNAVISPLQMAQPSPAIPQDLLSLETPGIAKAAAAQPTPQPHARQTSWILSLAIGAGIVAVTLGGAFYAIPTFAGTGKTASRAADKLQPATTPVVEVAAPTATPAKPDHPLASAIEVTGIRFITDVPNQHPQVHYLVVNHSASPVADVTVTVILHAEKGTAPLSQFSFRVPRLEAYESKEMVNAIEQLNRPVAAPDWRHTNVELALEGPITLDSTSRPTALR